jgi:hypothetical protein
VVVRREGALAAATGAKLSAILESVGRDEEQIQRVNFTDRGLFTITGGYDVKGLRRTIS